MDKTDPLEMRWTLWGGELGGGTGYGVEGHLRSVSAVNLAGPVRGYCWYLCLAGSDLTRSRQKREHWSHG